MGGGGELRVEGSIFAAGLIILIMKQNENIRPKAERRGLARTMRAAVCALLVAAIVTACGGGKGTYYEEEGSIFHTVYHIKYRTNKGPLTDKIAAELQAFDASLNPFNKESILARVNRNEPVEVDDWFVTVFNRAMDVAERSGGVFDVTAAPLINLWGFGYEQKDSVSPAVIDSMLQFVGYRKVRLEGRRVVKDDPRLQLSFSAIAKGYACDVVAALLEREGVEDYMVEIGGEVASRGMNARGECWRIGINKPEDDTTGVKNDMQEVVELCGRRGMATSGNYRNFHMRDGKKVAHTIDPRTGYPSQQNILSATIVAPDCMTADAYATAFMAMGLDAACRMAESVPEIAYYVIYADTSGVHRVKMSPTIQEMIVGKTKSEK